MSGKDWGPEGYCSHCNRDVPLVEYRNGTLRGSFPLKPTSLLARHWTGYGGGYGPCKGSDRRPARRPKYASRKHAYSYTPKTRVRPEP